MKQWIKRNLFCRFFHVKERYHPWDEPPDYCPNRWRCLKCDQKSLLDEIREAIETIKPQ